MDVKDVTIMAAHKNNNFLIKEYFKVINKWIVPIGSQRTDGELKLR
jgi:hypothetical protein